MTEEAYKQYLVDKDTQAKATLAILTEMKAQQAAVKDSELHDIKSKLEAATNSTHEQFKTIERSIQDIRDIARDALAVSIGIDGKNGLRGALEGLVKDVAGLTKDADFLRQSANSYHEMRGLLLRFFASSVAAFLLQFGGAVWYLSNEHSQQQADRAELTKVIAYVEKNKGEIERLQRQSSTSKPTNQSP